MGTIHDDLLQIVHVIKPFKLIDEESYQRVYWRRDGLPLASGYYVVRWPSRARTRVFDENAIFHGPFRSRQAAAPLAQRLRARRRVRAAPGVARRRSS